ncbi:MAG: DEAD/DEAH box helicase [Waterburya sp.]
MQRPNYHLLLQSILNKSLKLSLDRQDNLEQVYASGNGDIAEFLQENLLWQGTVPPQKARRYKLPKTLPPILRKALKVNGINSLYSHQARCLQAIRKDKDVIITTDTASGKTLGAYIPILENLLQNPTTALAFYGLKALSADQNHKLSQLINAIPNSSRPFMALLNGDISKPERESLLARSPQIITTTPELIHYALRQVHFNSGWQHFFSRLKFIVIDEAHTFDGVYGANMTNLLRRIKLTVDKYDGNSRKLQFIFLSATVGNPKELARKLSDRPKLKNDRLYWIDKSGASKPEQQLIVTRPSSNPNVDTARIILFLLNQNLTGICFVNSRQSIKSLFSVLIAEAEAQKYYAMVSTSSKQSNILALTVFLYYRH